MCCRRQNRDVTNHSRGLLPQLVDVLYALAESQALLTNRIRRAHLELLGIHPTDGARSWQALPLNPGGPAELPPVAAAPVPARHVGELITPDQSGGSTERSADPCETDSNSGIEPRGVIPNDPEVATPPKLPTETATSAHQHEVSQHATRSQPDDLRATRRDETTMERGVRSYNFFDELDTRLADLGNCESKSEEAGP